MADAKQEVNMTLALEIIRDLVVKLDDVKDECELTLEESYQQSYELIKAKDDEIASLKNTISEIQVKHNNDVLEMERVCEEGYAEAYEIILELRDKLESASQDYAKFDEFGMPLSEKKKTKASGKAQKVCGSKVQNYDPSVYATFNHCAGAGIVDAYLPVSTRAADQVVKQASYEQIQKLQELKKQFMAQNPHLLGLGVMRNEDPLPDVNVPPTQPAEPVISVPDINAPTIPPPAEPLLLEDVIQLAYSKLSR